MYTVLIAEDELLVRIGIKVSLLESGLPLTVIGDTSNGLSAYELFICKSPDIVITDIKMPGLDGLELIRKIRSGDKECAIIIISCLEQFSLLRQAMENNVSAYLLKATMTREEITSSIRKAIDDLGMRNHLPYNSVDNSPSVLPVDELITAFVKGRLTESELVEQLKNTAPPPDLMAIFFLRRRKLDNITRRSLEEVFKLRLSVVFRTSIFMISDECLICLMNGTERNITPLVEELQVYVKKTFSLTMATIVKTLDFGFDSLVEELKKCLIEVDEYKAYTSQLPQVTKHEITRAIEFINEHYMEPLTLKKMASVVGLSPNYFSNLFTSEIRQGFVSYLNNTRIEKAKHLLTQDDLLVYEVANYVGFDDEAYFSRIFKKVTGESPKEWRTKENGTIRR